MVAAALKAGPMKNVAFKVEGTELVIRIDLSKDFGASASGKTTIIASTSGNHAVAQKDGKDVILGLNLYTKN